jgi:TIR domain
VIVARIFISYATSDRPVAEEVLGWLRAAGHEAFLDDDLRNGISVGEDWKQRLYRELREVDAVIGVVTSSFVASDGPRDFRTALLVVISRCVLPVQELVVDLAWGFVSES